MTNLLPIHARTGLHAIGMRRDGRPIWPVMGGDGTDPAPNPQQPAGEPAAPAPQPQQQQPGQAQPQGQPPPPPPGFQPAPPQQDSGDDGAQQLLAAAVQADNGGGDPNQLGDAGKRALAAEREARKAAEDASKQLQQQLEHLAPLTAVLDQIRKAAVPDAEKTDTERLQEQVAQLQQETTAERRQRWLLEIIQDHGLSRDDAAWLHGDTREELEAAADRFAKRLAATQPAPQPAPSDPAPAGEAQPTPANQPAPAAAPNGPRPDPSQGARGPVDIHAQIAEAMEKGDVRRSIALKQQLAAQGQNQ